jgi:hypothetical protein
VSQADVLLRVYSPDECSEPGTGKGYPHVWHRCFGCRGSGCASCDGAGSIKALIRQRAGHRCIRCGHPYPPGTPPTWSPCDGHCTHRSPFRWWADGAGCELLAVGVGSCAREMVAAGLRVEALRRVLTTHHLNGDKRDCRWWNLTSLCQRCHLVIQGKVNLANPWPYEHSEWFKPYAAGYYAATILGEELDREETEARLDELLALARRQDRLPGMVA